MTTGIDSKRRGSTTLELEVEAARGLDPGRYLSPSPFLELRLDLIELPSQFLAVTSPVPRDDRRAPTALLGRGELLSLRRSLYDDVPAPIDPA